jgi:hypothetical protein
MGGGVWRRPWRDYYTRRPITSPSEGGPPHGTGTITATGTLTGSGTKHGTGSGTLTATGVLAGDGTKHAVGSGSITATGVLSGSGSGVTPGEAHFTFAVDWNADGDFTGPGEDVTERVLASGGFSTEFGRDQARALSPPAAGRAAFTLYDASGDYSPENTASPLAGDILPARQVESTVELDGVTRTLFRGHMDDYQLKVERNRKTVDVTALDALAVLRGTKISTGLYRGLRTDQAITVILDAVGWPDTPLNANPYMASGITDWTALNCTLAHSTSVVPPDGEGSLRLTPDGVSPGCGAGSNVVNVSEGRDYAASMWAMAPGGGEELLLLVNWYGPGDVFLGPTIGTSALVTPGVWTRFQETFSAPATALKAVLWTWQTASPAADQVWYATAVKLTDPNDDPYRQLDVGATVTRWWWEEDTDAWDAVVKLVNSEGPPATVHANENGGIVFRNRHHRLLSPGATASQATLTDGADGYEPAYSTMSYDHGWSEVINHVSVKVDEFAPAGESSVVWESQDLRSIPLGETVEITAETNDPIWEPQLDYDLLGGDYPLPDLIQVSSRTFRLTFLGLSSSAAIGNIRIYGHPVTSQRSYQVEHRDTASAASYGLRSYTPELPWVGVHDADAIAQLIIGARAQRLPIVEITLVGARNPVRMVQQFGRDLSDRVHITDGHTGLDTDFHIEQIKHRVAGGGFVTTTFGCEQAATQPAAVFVFDDPDHGFDDGVFGSVGLDEPTTLFIFDQSGHGFDDGLFAT